MLHNISKRRYIKDSRQDIIYYSLLQVLLGASVPDSTINSKSSSALLVLVPAPSKYDGSEVLVLASKLKNTYVQEFVQIALNRER
jgi:hypothetical protein